MANSNVKCRACGNIIDKTTAFCASKGQYYCNQEEYDTKKQLYSILSEYVNTTNTILHKEMILWGTDYKKICNYLQDNRSLFEYAMKKNFNSEYAKIRYFSAIIKNSNVQMSFTKTNTNLRQGVNALLITTRRSYERLYYRR